MQEKDALRRQEVALEQDGDCGLQGKASGAGTCVPSSGAGSVCLLAMRHVARLSCADGKANAIMALAPALVSLHAIFW